MCARYVFTDPAEAIRTFPHHRAAAELACALQRCADHCAASRAPMDQSCWIEQLFGRPLRMTASYYRFYLRRGGQTFAAEVLECDSDSDAMVKAKELLATSTTFRLMEVWQGTRKVGIVERS